ncbi:MAG: alpha/beta hydrolase [Nocardioidaceae bacterium]|nr:alpha/beta hydrolase [Nocardioidaceae bacterium]
MGLLRRQLVIGALVGNAIRPLPGARAGMAVFGAGWLTGELAPHLLAFTALDTATQVARRKATGPGLAAAAVTAGGLAWLIKDAYGAGRVVESSLSEGLGADYRDRLATPPTARDLAMPWGEVARPFRMRRREVQRIHDVNYTTGGRRARLDVYLPRPVAGEPPLTGAPVLVQVHGGAWMTGKKEDQGQLLMGRMASRGWVCVALNYRLAPKHRWPAQIVDTKKAVAWVKDNIEQYGGDPSYVVITGGSAGGHLAALTALTPGDPAFQPGFEDADTSVAACVPFYGVYDLAALTGTRASQGLRRFLARWIFPSPPDAEHLVDYEQASPLARITPEAPDFYVIHGSNDTVVPIAQARAFVARLRETSKQTVTYSEVHGAQHAFEVFSSIRSQHVVKAVERWLEWHRATRIES